jgi:hypothetical protein
LHGGEALSFRTLPSWSGLSASKGKGFGVWEFLGGRVYASTMFFHIYLDRNMQLHPRHFGPHLRDKLIAKLIQDVEGTCRYPFLSC